MMHLLGEKLQVHWIEVLWAVQCSTPRKWESYVQETPAKMREVTFKVELLSDKSIRMIVFKVNVWYKERLAITLLDRSSRDC